MSISTPEKRKLQEQQIQAILKNPILLRKLTNQVYELLEEDLRNQRDRQPSYWGG